MKSTALSDVSHSALSSSLAAFGPVKSRNRSSCLPIAAVFVAIVVGIGERAL